ncbi:MAG: hypothetical protein WCP79_06255 [Bacillota bacterium]
MYCIKCGASTSYMSLSCSKCGYALAEQRTYYETADSVNVADMLRVNKKNCTTRLVVVAIAASAVIVPWLAHNEIVSLCYCLGMLVLAFLAVLNKLPGYYPLLLCPNCAVVELKRCGVANSDIASNLSDWRNLYSKCSGNVSILGIILPIVFVIIVTTYFYNHLPIITLFIEEYFLDALPGLLFFAYLYLYRKNSKRYEEMLALYCMKCGMPADYSEAGSLCKLNDLESSIERKKKESGIDDIQETEETEVDGASETDDSEKGNETRFLAYAHWGIAVWILLSVFVKVDILEIGIAAIIAACGFGIYRRKRVCVAISAVVFLIIFLLMAVSFAIKGNLPLELSLTVAMAVGYYRAIKALWYSGNAKSAMGSTRENAIDSVYSKATRCSRDVEKTVRINYFILTVCACLMYFWSRQFSDTLFFFAVSLLMITNIGLLQKSKLSAYALLPTYLILLVGSIQVFHPKALIFGVAFTAIGAVAGIAAIKALLEYKLLFPQLTESEQHELQFRQNKQLLIPAILFNVVYATWYIVAAVYERVGIFDFYYLVAALFLVAAFGICRRMRICVVASAAFLAYTFVRDYFDIGIIIHHPEYYLELALFLIPITVYSVAWQAAGRIKKINASENG